MPSHRVRNRDDVKLLPGPGFGAAGKQRLTKHQVRITEGDMKVVKNHLRITEGPPADPEPTQPRPARNEPGPRGGP